MLLAGRRLSDNPRGAFRAVSGLILAIFVTSVSVGVISTILAGSRFNGLEHRWRAQTVTDQFAFDAERLRCPSVSGIGAVSSLRAIHGRDVV